MIKILVIEDEGLIRSNIIDLLELEGFDAIGAENGLVGVHLAQQHQPDLILCDVMMPKLDGYGVLAALGQDSTTAMIPFIFLTAVNDARQGMELGADDYLIKPCKPDQLLRAIAARLKKQATITQHYSTALKQVSEQLNNLAYYDSLTNLPNRLLLQDRFNQIIAQSKVPLAETGAPHEQWIPILCVSLDRFNRLLELLGHSCGDLLIKAAAERLQSCLDSRDTVARLSADQFAIILATICQKKEIAKVAQTILNAFSQSFLLEDGNEVFITASIGIALYSHHGAEIGKLLQHANIAMNHAQQQGGNKYEFFKNTFNISTEDSIALETSLRYALERQELQVHYQPQVDLRTGQIVGAEALLRWHHPERGMISPAKFIPIAEETGLIIPIGEWVLRTATQQAAAWQAASFTPLRVAVNLSGRQFDQANLRLMLVQILVETGLDPKYLELELTESILVQNTEAGVTKLKAFKTLDVQVAIDDFGTGYSSLSYLQQFPFDTLKIDQCFVRNLTIDAKTTAITTAIIQMAHELNLKVIAEGVETQAELAFLCQHECDEMQGYLFSSPLSATAFENLLKTGKTLHLPQRSN